ncbi:uncharacterized protein F4807DRAFT_331262 [Annulohypoxylon truncatum]|uniref:uncharacterized protein n=1 Tax=Annulohypoxylon truncatum TaxID=327061 RepID=UPI0020089272|nr:uncharacterized protein F4807DRAFT_331262 [Annulohypoxylon truncatum]KAI1204498.1 hypothetical protein F4807DRAFT_331262 [Annulohypoxylon truncatum]
MAFLLFTSMALFTTKLVVQAADCLDVAQTEIPSCAQSCFLENAPSVGCGGLDFACQCQNEASLYAAIEPCVASGCSESSFQAVIDGASSVCNCAAAIPRALTVGSSFGSYVGAAATVTGSGTVPATIVGTVSGLVSGTVASNPTSNTMTSASATSSTSRSGALSYQSDLGSGSIMRMAVLAMLFNLLF